jgi:hypothetical protein
MTEIEKIMESMEPTEALTALAPALKKILAHLDEDSRVQFVTGLLDEGDSDKVSSMVNL